jgi:hypothetical protein
MMKQPQQFGRFPIGSGYSYPLFWAKKRSKKGFPLQMKFIELL